MWLARIAAWPWGPCPLVQRRPPAAASRARRACPTPPPPGPPASARSTRSSCSQVKPSERRRQNQMKLFGNKRKEKQCCQANSAAFAGWNEKSSVGNCDQRVAVPVKIRLWRPNVFFWSPPGDPRFSTSAALRAFMIAPESTPESYMYVHDFDDQPLQADA